MKKVEINISNRSIYTLVAILMVVALGAGIYAYGTSNPSKIGHTATEIDGLNDLIDSRIAASSSSGDSCPEGYFDWVFPADYNNSNTTVYGCLKEGISGTFSTAGYYKGDCKMSFKEENGKLMAWMRTNPGLSGGANCDWREFDVNGLTCANVYGTTCVAHYRPDGIYLASISTNGIDILYSAESSF